MKAEVKAEKQKLAKAKQEQISALKQEIERLKDAQRDAILKKYVY